MMSAGARWKAARTTAAHGASEIATTESALTCTSKHTDAKHSAKQTSSTARSTARSKQLRPSADQPQPGDGHLSAYAGEASAVGARGSRDVMFAETFAVQSTTENAAAEKPEAADVQALPNPKPRMPPTETRVPPNSATQQPSVSLPPAAQHRVPRRCSHVDTAPAPTPSHGTSHMNGMAHTLHPVNTTPSFDTYPQNLTVAAEMQHAIAQQRSVYRHPHSMVGFEHPHSMAGYPAASGMPPHPGLGYSRWPAHMDLYHHPYPASAPPILPPHAYNHPGPRTNSMWPSMYPGGHPSIVNAASTEIEHLPFARAHDFAQGLAAGGGLRTEGDWRAYCQSGGILGRVPAAPDEVYVLSFEPASYDVTLLAPVHAILGVRFN